MLTDHSHNIYAVAGCHCTFCDKRRNLGSHPQPIHYPDGTGMPTIDMPELPPMPESIFFHEPVAPVELFDWKSAVANLEAKLGDAGLDQAVYFHRRGLSAAAVEVIKSGKRNLLPGDSLDGVVLVAEDFAQFGIEVEPPYVSPPNAATFLRRAADAMDQRAALRDSPQGERSMARAVAMFNALTDCTAVDLDDRPITELDGWRFMVCLKMARSINGKFNADDYDDMAAYAALAGECAAKDAT